MVLILFIYYFYFNSFRKVWQDLKKQISLKPKKTNFFKKGVLKPVERQKKQYAGFPYKILKSQPGRSMWLWGQI